VVTYVPIFAAPSNFPIIKYPDDNAYNYSRWKLGKKLFYDNALSRNQTINCGSCHQTQFAMADNQAFSLGVEGAVGFRNAPTLVNLAYQPYYNFDGSSQTLEMQVLVPIQEHVEFDFNIVEIAKRLGNNITYQSMSKEAYNREIDYYVITRALANFERTLISGNSKYDKYTRQETNLTAEELRGFNLFTSTRTNCNTCHAGFNFTNYTFENNGLSNEYNDEGRARVTKLYTDKAKFKVPTLRNIEKTAPYMHNGSKATLTEVIAHYNSGGFNHPNKSNLIKPLHLSTEEQNDLVAFLKTLTDESFIKNPFFKKD
jgi:cytochrome c peroxidase